MAGSTGSRILWGALLTPPLLVLAATGAMALWPERIVGLTDSVRGLWSDAPGGDPGSRMHHHPMVRMSPPPPAIPPAVATLRGTVRTPDGRPFRGKYSLGILRRRMGTVMVDRGDALIDGRSQSTNPMDEPGFSVPLEFDPTYLTIIADGYAPRIIGPYSQMLPRKAVGIPKDGGPPPKAAVAATPGGDPEPVEVILEPGFPFEVRVVDALGGPILGAEVTACMTVDRMSVKLPNPQRTDDDGRAVFDDLTRDGYEFEVNVHGFRYPDDAIAPKVVPGGSATIALERGPVAGVAVDEAGRPVEDALLLVASEMDDLLEVETDHPSDRIVLGRSDAEGRFSLPALHDDSTYLIRAEGPDGSLGFAPGVRRGGDPVKVTLRPLRTVRGLAVPDAFGRPTWVQIRRSVPTGFDVRGTLADVRGVMRHNQGFQPGPGGLFEYQAWGSVDTELVVDGRSIPVPWPPTEEPLRVEAPDQSPTERSIRIQVAVEGSSAPVRGPMVLHLVNNPPERTNQGVARQVEIRESTGRFDCLSSESFRLDSSAIPGHWTAPGVIPGGPEADVAVGIRAFPAGSISGRVIDPDGASVGVGAKVAALFDPAWAGARSPDRPQTPSGPIQGNQEFGTRGMSYLISPGRAAEEAETDADGRFEIPCFPQNVRSRIVVERGRYFVQAAEVSLDPKNPRAKVEARLPKKASASVHILDPEGRPIPGARLTLSLRRSASEMRRWDIGTTDAEGRCTVDDLGEGEPNYVLSATFPADFRPIVAPLTPGGAPLELRAERGRVLEGRVVEAVTGWPIPGLDLFARPPGAQVDSEARTDADGRFRLSTLPDGPILLEDRRSLKWLSPRSPLVPEGSSGPILIRLIDLRPTDPQPRPIPRF